MDKIQTFAFSFHFKQINQLFFMFTLDATAAEREYKSAAELGDAMLFSVSFAVFSGIHDTFGV